MNESQIQLGLALFAMVQRGIATLHALEKDDPAVYAEIERRHVAAQTSAQAALDDDASQAGRG